MGYAILKSGLGYRAVNSQSDIDQTTETYSEFPPSGPSAAEQWALYQGRVQAALVDSDITMHRIGEGVALGATSWTAADVVAFVQWRQALRAILSQTQPATIPTSLPVKPAYPAGT